MNHNELRSMRQELEKAAASFGLAHRTARWLTTSPLRTTALSGGAGAVVGGAQGAEEGGLSGGIRGAIKGGLTGAAVGGTASGLGRAYRDVKLLNPGISTADAVSGVVKRIGKGLSNFGKRQLHGFTGAYSEDPAAIGMRGTARSKEKIDLLRRRLADELRNASPRTKEKLIRIFNNEKRDLLEEGIRGDRAIAAGVTNLPGVVKGLVKNPKRTVKALWQETTGGTHGGAVVGLPLVAGLYDIARGDESDTGGRSMKQKLVGLGTGVAGGVATAGLPIVPQIVGSGLVEYTSDKLTSKRKGGRRS